MHALSQALAHTHPVHLYYADGVLRLDGQACRLETPLHARAAAWVSDLMRLLPAELVALDLLAPPHASGDLNTGRLRRHLADVAAGLQAAAPLWDHGTEVHGLATATLAVPVTVKPVVTVTSVVAVCADDHASIAIGEIAYAQATALISDTVTAALLAESSWALASGLRGLALHFRAARAQRPSVRHPPETPAGSSAPAFR
ncbi:hypothetical protein [Azospirillum ramasamyi]|uniref:Uncharacterized protein n=1 Tax=Azospirillum ramasamyi TaxID=682998 RepID=A0A2U9SEQ4_9PROT|nr:hypothetical protein [Azospirillum ramasamyi]AWU98095.1 hypothetical protein DM194_27810 [Azospirillum ramasamyi]